MKNTVKISAFILAAGLILSCGCQPGLIQVKAGTEISVTEDEYEIRYKIENGAVTVTGCNRSLKELVIPDKIEGYPVESIGYGAFSAYWLEKVVIPDSVKIIGTSAFDSMPQLKEITMPFSVISCNLYFLEHSSVLEKVTFRNPLFDFPDTLKIPENTVISGYSNSTAKKFAEEKGFAFESLGEFDMSYYDREPEYELRINEDGSGTYGPYSFTSKNSEICITRCDKNVIGSLIIPEQINNMPVTEIGKDSFMSCKFLEKVVVPDTVKTIRSGAFGMCYKLSNLYLPEGLSTIINNAFCFGAYTTFELPSTVSGIRATSFAGCEKLTDVNVREGETRGSMFSRDGILYREMKFPTNSYRYLVYYPAGRTSAAEFTVPDDITSIDDYAFLESSLEKVIIKDNVTTIGKEAFSASKTLKEAILPETITEIPGGLFASCTAIENVVIPSSVKSIGDSAFFNCTSMKTLCIPSNVEKTGKNVFYKPKGAESVFIMNPDCELDPALNFVGTDINEDYTIYGYDNSTAQEFAELKGYKFCNIRSYIKDNTGDLSLDGTVNAEDAVKLSKYLLSEPTDEISVLLGDVDEDSKTNIADLCVLKSMLYNSDN